MIVYLILVQVFDQMQLLRLVLLHRFEVPVMVLLLVQMPVLLEQVLPNEVARVQPEQERALLILAQILHHRPDDRLRRDQVALPLLAVRRF